jgi:hypothetical protein
MIRHGIIRQPMLDVRSKQASTGQRGLAMELHYVRAEIERVRLQVRHQRKDIQALHPDDER